MQFIITSILFRWLFSLINTALEIAVWLTVWVFRIAMFLGTWAWHKAKSRRQAKADEMEFTL